MSWTALIMSGLRVEGGRALGGVKRGSNTTAGEKIRGCPA